MKAIATAFRDLVEHRSTDTVFSRKRRSADLQLGNGLKRRDVDILADG